MKDNTEFQIMLFNPYSYKIKAVFWINNKKMENSLVIRPGERIWLERSLDNENKFLFSTYFVDADSGEVKQAIKNNGDIEIYFYREANYNSITDNIVWYSANDYGINTDCAIRTTSKDYSDKYYGHSICTNNDANYFPTLTCTNANTIKSDANYCNTTFNSTITGVKCGIVGDKGDVGERGVSGDYLLGLNKVETGRIEEGSKSDQKFVDAKDKFEIWSFNNLKFKILPESIKPRTSADLQKIYCPECGRKLKTKYKFCPYCGEKL